MAKYKTDYALRTKLDRPFEQAVEQVKAALKQEGFGVLTELDMKSILKQKLDVEFRKYVILGACHPPFAKRALHADLEAGLLLPCPVVVYEEGAGSVVAIADPVVRVEMTENAELEAVAVDARARLERVITALQG